MLSGKPQMFALQIAMSNHTRTPLADNCPQQKRILMFEQNFKNIDDVFWKDSGM
jgi:hypothetical protein